jgi:hypothetical protein
LANRRFRTEAAQQKGAFSLKKKRVAVSLSLCRVPIANGYELRQGLLDVGVHCEMAVYTGAKPLCVYSFIRKNGPKIGLQCRKNGSIFKRIN